MNRCQITAENGMLVVATPYERSLVESIKDLPYTERRYDGNRKVWLVDPRHGPKLVAWVNVYMGEAINLPLVNKTNNQTIMKLLEVRYIGACKSRDDGSSVAFGMVGTDWPLIFPESVLREWFDSGPAEPTEQMTLYQILGVNKSVTTEDLKRAFRRMAMQWHPDHCREPNAHETFIRIQEAHSILSDTNKRARYDAGLQLQKEFEKSQKYEQPVLQPGFRSPLRCGQLLVNGIEKVGRLEVTKILAWEDITKNGLTLVTSWAAGAKQPTEDWL